MGRLVSVVYVGNIRPDAAFVDGRPLIYVGRQTDKWHMSPLGNAPRTPPALGIKGAFSEYRRWLWTEWYRYGVNSPAWAEIARLASIIRSGYPLALGCTCGLRDGYCHAYIVQRALLWYLGLL